MDEQRRKLVPIKETMFEGLKAVEIKTKKTKLVVVTEFGPRVAFLGKPGGKNIFLWQPGKYGRGDWDLRGGHRVWATRPGADENEGTYATDNEPCDVKIRKNAVTIIGAESQVDRTRRGMTIKVVDDTTLQIDNFLTNTGDMLWSGGVWALTCTLPTRNAQYAVPVGDDSNWDAFNMVFYRAWGGHGKGGFNDRQIEVRKDLILIKPAGVENKRMVQSHKGIIAMRDNVNKLTFAKKVKYEAAGSYPLNTNIAFYIGPKNFMVEMETMGPEETLKPGATLHHVETWKLVPSAISFSKAKNITDLF